jgi:hypothetical protein
MATDAVAGPDVTAFERIGAPNVPSPPYNQLDLQIAGLRAELMVAEEQLRRTEDMLRRLHPRPTRSSRSTGGRTGAADPREADPASTAPVQWAIRHHNVHRRPAPTAVMHSASRALVRDYLD